VSSFEKLFSVLFFLVGTGIFATVIVYVQDVVAQLDVTASIYKSRCASLKRFLLREGVSTEFREQCFSHLERQWCLFRGISGVELSKYFPANLYADAVHLSVKAKLDELFYVSKRSQDFKKAFASKLTTRQYAKGDFIFRGGEICNTLFVLISGEIALVADDEIFEVSNLVNLRLAAVSNAKKGGRRPSKARLSIVGGSSHPPGITETPLQHHRFTRTASKLLTVALLLLLALVLPKVFGDWDLQRFRRQLQIDQNIVQMNVFPVKGNFIARVGVAHLHVAVRRVPFYEVRSELDHSANNKLKHRFHMLSLLRMNHGIVGLLELCVDLKVLDV
jgi:hypothetical protein